VIVGSSSGSLTATTSSPVVASGGRAGYAVQLTGTFVGTVTFEASLDGGTTYVACGMTPISDIRAGVIVSTATAAGIWVLPSPGGAAISHLRARCSAYTSGTIVVTVTSGD
jgi:hypothetical protein